MMLFAKPAVVALAVSLAIAGCGGEEKPPSTGKHYTVYLLPKVKGIDYFETCAAGAREAADELKDVDLTYDGPTSGNADESAKMIRQWAQKKADVIAVSVNDPAVLGSAMKDARDKGSKVITWDADAAPDTRELMVQQATAQQIGEALVDTLAKDIAEGDAAKAEGEVAIISAAATAANQNEWMKFMKERLAKYPNLKLVATEYCNEDQAKATSIAKDLIAAHPNLKGIWAISSTAFPGAAQGIQQANKSGKVQVTGLATPNGMKTFVKDGTVKSVILWNTKDLGYLTIYTAEALASGKLKPTDTSITAGRLGKKEIKDGQVLLGDILVFNKDNIDKYNF